MPKHSYGEKVKERVKRLLEALLDHVVRSEYEDDDLGITCCQEQDGKVIRFETNLAALVRLTERDRHEGKLTKAQVREAISHYLMEHLEILRDERVKKQGSEDWQFSLTLWERCGDKEKNLIKFSEEWHKRRSEPSKKVVLEAQFPPPNPTPEESSGNRQQYQLELAKIPTPNYPELLGREQEIDRIKNALSDSKGKRLVGITGLGGNGKTSVAIEVARAFREMGFQYIVWQTASTKFNSTRMTFDTIIDEMAKQLAFSELLTNQGGALERKTREVLSSEKVLIVLDNMETSESQNEIAVRLSSVLGNSKVLFTSRNRFDTLEVDVWDYHLQGLQEEASIKLMKQVAQERDIPYFDLDNSGALLKFTGNSRTGYLPLALKLVTGQLKNKNMIEVEKGLFNVRLTEEDVQEDDRNLFEKFWLRVFYPSFNMLSPSDLDFILFLALLKEQEGTTKDILLSLTQEILTEAQFVNAINNTWRLCLLEREERYDQRYYLHVLTSTFFNVIRALSV